MPLHILNVESVRWHNPLLIPYNEKSCPACLRLEDKFFTLLECNLYSGLRKKIIRRTISLNIQTF